MPKGIPTKLLVKRQQEALAKMAHDAVVINHAACDHVGMTAHELSTIEMLIGDVMNDEHLPTIHRMALDSVREAAKMYMANCDVRREDMKRREAAFVAKYHA